MLDAGRTILLEHDVVSQDASPTSDEVTSLPAGIRELLTNRIDSFEKLEIVITLSKAQRTTMTMDELSRTLKTPRDAIRQAVMELRAVALVDLTSRGEVQLMPPTTRDEQVIADLVKLHDDDRFVLVKALGEIAMERLRGMTSRVFADAFLFRRKSPKDDADG